MIKANALRLVYSDDQTNNFSTMSLLQLVKNEQKRRGAMREWSYLFAEVTNFSDIKFSCGIMSDLILLTPGCWGVKCSNSG